MASNKIQIKRSTSNAITAVSLAAGELAFTTNGNILAIGDPGGGSPIPIGGARTPGTLTANQALVANSTSGINQVITANLVVNRVNANNDWGTPGYVLTSAGSGSNVFWTSSSGFGVDSQAQYTWSNTHTFQNTVTFNLTINGTANNALYLGGIDASQYLSISTGDARYQTSAGLSSNVAKLDANNSSYFGNNLPSYYASAASLNNYQTTAGLAGNVATLTSYNSLYLGGQLPGYYTTNNQLATYVSQLTAGNTNYVGVTPAAAVVNSTHLTSNLARYATLSGANFGPSGSVNAFSYTTGSGYGNITTGGVVINTTHIAIGNSSVNGAIYSNGTTIISTITANNANNAYYLNGVIGSSYATQSYVQAAVYNATGGAATETYVNQKADAAYTNSVTYTSGKFTDALVASGQAYTNAIAMVYSNNGNFNGNNVFYGSNTIFNSNVIMNNSLSVKDITATGNLTILGTITTINSTELQIKDNSILLADNQANTSTYTDSADFILYGQFGNTANVWYSGVYRDSIASNSHYSKAVWKLFAAKEGSGSVPAEPGGFPAVQTTGDGYRLGTLSAYLEPYGVNGRFVANSTTISIAANTSIPVTIAANTLTLSSALAASYGGTGQTSFSTGDIIYAGTSSTMNKLSVGTAGQVLQISSSNLPTYADLDGGSF
jgi:hypothetical protein